MQSGGGFGGLGAAATPSSGGYHDYSEMPIHTGYQRRGDPTRGFGSARGQFDPQDGDDGAIGLVGATANNGLPGKMDDDTFEKLYDSLSLDEKIEHNDWRIRGKAYDELVELFESESVKQRAKTDRVFLENIQQYVAKMLKDKNQVNFAKINNFDVGKHTLHYVLPVLCEKPVTLKSKSLFDEIIERIMVIDSEYLFQELMGRLKQKNAVTILHNLEIILKLVNEQKIRNPEDIKELLKRLAALTDQSDRQIRKLAIDCITKLFEIIEDDLETLTKMVFKSIREYQLNELRAVYNRRITKSHLIRLFDVHYEAHAHRQNVQQQNEPPKIKGSGGTNQAGKPGFLPRISGVDLAAIIPGKLLDMTYISNNTEKKNILDDFLKKLETVQEIKVPSNSNQASALIKVLKDCLEGSNILIVLTAIQITTKLFQLLPGCFNEIITKQILMEASYKFQNSNSKNSLNDYILALVSAAVKTEAISTGMFLTFVFDLIQNTKKTNTRECFLVWFATRMQDVQGELNVRDSIDWTYEPEPRDLSPGGQPPWESDRKGPSAALSKLDPVHINTKLNEILHKEQNQKVKSMLKGHIKRFEDIQIKGIKPPETPALTGGLNTQVSGRIQGGQSSGNLAGSKKNILKKPANTELPSMQPAKPNQQQGKGAVGAQGGGGSFQHANDPVPPVKNPIKRNTEASDEKKKYPFFEMNLPSQTEEQRQSLLDYSNDSITSLNTGSATALQGLLAGSRSLTDITQLQTLLSCVQNMPEEVLEPYLPQLRDSLLSELSGRAQSHRGGRAPVLASKIYKEDQPLFEKYLMAVLVNMETKSDPDDLHQLVQTLKIVLHTPWRPDLDSTSRQALFEELSHGRGLLQVFEAFQEIYNEVKFTISVGHDSCRLKERPWPTKDRDT